MVKDYYPISIEKIHKEIPDEEKINGLIHNNFCLYKYNKGKNKNKLCLNKFKDVNDLQYCFMHRWEIRPWLRCKTNGCNGKTKIDVCRNCKRIFNTKHPDVTNDEIIALSNECIHTEIIKKVIPNAKYRIRQYNLHEYYKNFTIHINLIVPKYINNVKVKKIKKDEYCKYFININKETILNDINNYIIYLDNLFKKLKICINLITNLKRFRKRFISFDNICNIPLPPVTDDEEILLNLDFNNYKKEIKDSNSKPLELLKLSFLQINEINNSKDNYPQTDKIQIEPPECNRCCNLLCLLSNEKKENKKLIIELKTKIDILTRENKEREKDVFSLNEYISKYNINKNSINNNDDKGIMGISQNSYQSLKQKNIFDLKTFVQYFEDLKIHLIELNIKNIEKLTPKPFDKHKRFLSRFINNVTILLTNEKQVNNKYNNKKTLIPTPVF